MNTPITVRQYQSADYHSLCELDAPLFEGMGGPVLFRHIEELFAPFFFVAENNHELIGYVLGGIHYDNPSLGKLIRIGVRDGYRRMECGTALTGTLFNTMKKEGVDRIHLTVAETNTSARAFYKKTGFFEKERRPNYFYPDIPRLVLEKIL